jgi:hypothetical protein
MPGRHQLPGLFNRLDAIGDERGELDFQSIAEICSRGLVESKAGEPRAAHESGE